jgi:hypothetical protein
MKRVLRSIAGLFFDDGRLALGVLVLFALTAAAAQVSVAFPATIALLVAGTTLLLGESVVRAARKR